jgi:hypothetical protein
VRYKPKLFIPKGRAYSFSDKPVIYCTIKIVTAQ